ncbi:hypothetical protein ACFYYH_12580 [Streptomyces sp. NPDC002018]|uniref:hypothetical protein n=1 Tax=Streptomyces sp. NPDC002018 TaxID=3364629 RepID=UPI003691927E
MTVTIIAVLGTLAGAVVAGLMQHRTTTRTARAAQAERRRQALADAIPALLGALVKHREKQYAKIADRRDGLADTVESRQARYAAHSAVTSAMDTLHMVTQDRALLDLAQDAIDAAMAIGNAPATELDAAGLRARQAHTALRVAGAAHIHA